MVLLPAEELRSVRSELAGLALQLRVAEADALEAERALGGRVEPATVFLESRLDEWVAAAHRQMENELAAARALAARRVNDARAEAAMLLHGPEPIVEQRMITWAAPHLALPGPQRDPRSRLAPPVPTRRWLHIDIVLPMVAVIILVVILLAWIG